MIVLLGVLFAVVVDASRRTIIESSERVRDEASRRISERITDFLEKAPNAVRQFQDEVHLGLLNPRDRPAAEAALFGLLLADEDLGELTLTYGTQTGFGPEPDGDIVLAAEGRGQLSVVRSTESGTEARFWSRHVYQENGVFVADRRDLLPGSNFSKLPMRREGTRGDS